jgi:hypothetical protein
MIGGLATTILVLGLVGGVVIYDLGFCQRADILPVAIIKVFTDAEQTEELKQGETIDWSEVHEGIQTKLLWINNTGPVDAVLGFNYRGDQLPGGWMEYWDYNNIPLVPNELRTVTVTLVLPEHVGAGVYEWESSIIATPA